MPNSYFQFKQFTVFQNKCAMKVCTDSCLFGAWVAKQISIHTKNILDIGTGTGLLSLMLQQQLPQTAIKGIDVDDNAVEQATENTLNFPSISIKKENILLLDESKSYELIICNPPFYENQLQSPQTAKNVAHHSNVLSHQSLVLKVSKLLTAQGKAFILLPYFNHLYFMELALQNGLHVQQIAYVKQTNKHRFFRVMLEFGFAKQETIVQETICIKDENNQYTTAFVNYLKPYYLHL